ncbi:hypothetical protein HZS_3461 [Henneguya salminicola]|nr:hypothetical protein HZS_3461 [Henneguya salminicola]
MREITSNINRWVLFQTNHPILLLPESTVCMYGEINQVFMGKIDPEKIELICDYCKLIALDPPFHVELEAVLN